MKLELLGINPAEINIEAKVKSIFVNGDRKKKAKTKPVYGSRYPLGLNFVMAASKE